MLHKLSNRFFIYKLSNNLKSNDTYIASWSHNCKIFVFSLHIRNIETDILMQVPEQISYVCITVWLYHVNTYLIHNLQLVLFLVLFFTRGWWRFMFHTSEISFPSFLILFFHILEWSIYFCTFTPLLILCVSDGSQEMVGGEQKRILF